MRIVVSHCLRQDIISLASGLLTSTGWLESGKNPGRLLTKVCEKSGVLSHTKKSLAALEWALLALIPTPISKLFST